MEKQLTLNTNRATARVINAAVVVIEQYDAEKKRANTVYLDLSDINAIIEEASKQKKVLDFFGGE